MHRMLVIAFTVVMLAGAAAAEPQTIVALGASQTDGKGVARSETYPAQLEAMLRAKGRDVRVINEGISGDTTQNMLGRLSSAVPEGTRLVILQPGGNDRRKAGGNATGEIESRLAARHVPVLLLPNGWFAGLPKSDGQHLTAEGYGEIARRLLPKVEAALGP